MEGLGLFGIFRKSSTILIANITYFLKLAAALLLPASLLTVFMSFFLSKIVQQRMLLAFFYMNSQSSSSRSPEEWLRSNAQLNASRMSAWSSFLFLLLQMAILILSLVSTIAFVQSVCRAYFDRKSTFKSSLSQIPKALRRILLTFFCMWIFLLLLVIGFAILTVISILLLKAVKVNPTILLLCIFFVFFGVFVYLTIVWNLAYVTSALEENWGWEAMGRSAYLVKGQRWLAFLLLLVFGSLGSAVSPGVLYKFNEDSDGGISATILIKLLLSVIGLTLIYMYQLVTTTVFYISCKIYHNESLDAIPYLRRSYGESDFANYMDLKSATAAVLAEP